MAKVKSGSGRYRYIYYKELGGAPKRKALSNTARALLKLQLIQGRVLDYGCGYGLDSDTLGWESYDPNYRPVEPAGQYDTIVVNHVINILTRNSRSKLFSRVNDLLNDAGTAYFSVPRNIPIRGKAGPQRRLQNYVVLTLPSIHNDGRLEIFQMAKNAAFVDKTQEYENGY